MITVLRDKYVYGWPRHAQGETVCAVDLGEALARDYATDAHFAAYATPNGRRLTTEAIDALGAIEMGVVVFDVDCPEVHGTREPAPEQWRRELRAKVQALAVEHSDPYFYETRGGARIVYRQQEPTVLCSQEDAQAWSRAYAVARAYLSRRFAIVADGACADWQRLYRLPHATREPGGKPENWPTWGDVKRIGCLLLNVTDADVAAARAKSKAFTPRRAASFEPSTASGEGLLFWLLRARGEIGREAPRGGWIVKCPNRAQHTSNSDGSDSTVLYPPLAGGEIGSIHCLHGHCSHITVSGWLRFFSDTELRSARRAAGIERVA